MSQREGNSKCFVLINRNEFALSVLYSTGIIIIINLKVDIRVILSTV